MRKHQKNSTLSALGCLLLISTLTACGTKPEVRPVENVSVSTKPVERPAPIVPKADELNLRDLNWIVVTPENIEEVLKNGGKIYALSEEGYKNLNANMRDIFSHIEQKNVIIAVYQRSYK